MKLTGIIAKFSATSLIGAEAPDLAAVCPNTEAALF